jgi:hypothetical protein
MGVDRMKTSKVLGWAGAFLVIAVGLHMVSLFVIGGAAVAWHLIASAAADPLSGGIVLVVAVLVGYIVGRAIDMTIASRKRHRAAWARLSASSLFVSATGLT